MTIERLSSVVPLLHTQLGYSYTDADGTVQRSGSTDCLVRSTQTAVEFTTFAAESPPPEIMRKKMGSRPTGGTSLNQSIRGVRAYGVEPIKYEKRNTGPVEQIIEWLKAGHCVVIVGQYGAIIDGWRELAGSKTYRAGHGVAAYGWDNGQTLDFDPLYDGRRANIPRGPQIVPFEMLAAFTTAGAAPGNGRAYAVPVNGRLVTTSAELAVVEGNLEASQKMVASLSRQVEKLNEDLAACEAGAGGDTACQEALAVATQQLADERDAHDVTRQRLAGKDAKMSEGLAL